MATSEEVPIEARVVSQTVCCHSRIRLDGHHVALDEAKTTPHEDHYIMGVVVQNYERAVSTGIRAVTLKHIAPESSNADYVVEDQLFLCWFFSPMDVIADPLLRMGCVVAVRRPYLRMWHDRIPYLNLHELRVELTGKSRDRFTRAVVFTLLDVPPSQCRHMDEPDDAADDPAQQLQRNRLLSLLRRQKVQASGSTGFNGVRAASTGGRAVGIATVFPRPQTSRPTSALPRVPPVARHTPQPSNSNQEPVTSSSVGARKRRREISRQGQRARRRQAGTTCSADDSRTRRERPDGEARDGVRLRETPNGQVTTPAVGAASQLRSCSVLLKRTRLLDTARESEETAAALQETAAAQETTTARRVGPRPSPSEEDHASAAAAAEDADPDDPGAGQEDAAESRGITTTPPNEPTASAGQRVSAPTPRLALRSVRAVRPRRRSDSSGRGPTESPVPDAARGPALDEFVRHAPPSDRHTRYTLIADVGLNDPGLRQRPDLMGVITSTPQPGRETAKRRFMSMVVIKDPSCSTADTPRYDIVLFLFLKNALELNAATGPEGLAPGTIVRARGAKIEDRDNKLDGRVFSVTQLTFFSSAADTPLEPLGSAHANVSDAEKARVSWLRDWWRAQQVRQVALDRAEDTSMCNVMVSGLYNLSCEAVWLTPPSGTGAATYLRVRDGTRCRIACVVHRPRPEPSQRDSSGTALAESEPYTETETQILRDDAGDVDIHVMASFCEETLRCLQESGQLKYVQLLRVRAFVDEDGPAGNSLKLSMQAEDEALVMEIPEGDPAAVSIYRRLTRADAGTQTAGEGQQMAGGAEVVQPAAEEERTGLQQREDGEEAEAWQRRGRAVTAALPVVVEADRDEPGRSGLQQTPPRKEVGLVGAQQTPPRKEEGVSGHRETLGDAAAPVSLQATEGYQGWMQESMSPYAVMQESLESPTSSCFELEDTELSLEAALAHVNQESPLSRRQVGRSHLSPEAACSEQPASSAQGSPSGTRAEDKSDASV